MKETEAFVTRVNVASTTMTSYAGLVKIMKAGRLKPEERNLEIVQLQLFDQTRGGTFQHNQKNSPDTS